MANLGTLAKVGEKGGLPVLRGHIACMTLETPIAIDPSGELARNGSPVFRVRLKTPSGRVFDGGTAYRNEIKTGENAGGIMFNIRIARQPGIPSGLDLSAWPEGDGWYLSMGQGEPERAPTPPVNDEVPW